MKFYQPVEITVTHRSLEELICSECGPFETIEWDFWGDKRESAARRHYKDVHVAALTPDDDPLD